MRRIILTTLAAVLGLNLAHGVTISYSFVDSDGTYPGSGITLPGDYPITATLLDDTATHYKLQLSGGAIDFGSKYAVDNYPSSPPPLIANFWTIFIDDSSYWSGAIDLGLYDEYVLNTSDRVDFGDRLTTPMLTHTASGDLFSNDDFLMIHAAGTGIVQYDIVDSYGTTAFSIEFDGAAVSPSQFASWTLTLEGTHTPSSNVPDSPLSAFWFALIAFGLLGAGYRYKLAPVA